MKSIDNIAALRVIDKTVDSHVFVYGYYSKGDGGGGNYYYDASDTTTPEDGGATIVANDGARWKLVHKGEVFAEQFGARGDRVSDDTLALQKAIDYCSARRITLVLTHHYMISQSLNYTHNTNIRGAIGSVHIDAVGGLGHNDNTFSLNPVILINGAFTALRNPTTTTVAGLHLENFGIVPYSRLLQDLPPYHYDAFYTAGAVGVDLAYTSDATILGLVGKGLDSLIWTSNSARNCHRPRIQRVGGYSCNNLINFCGSGPDYCAADILISDITMVRMNNNTLALNFVDGVTIANCKFFQAAYNNVQITNSGFINIVGCTFFETSLDNVYIQDSVYISIESTIMARAGWYKYPLFTNKVTNLKLERCSEVKVDAFLERAAGFNYQILSCNNVTFKAATSFAWYASGSNHDGSVQFSNNVEMDVNSVRYQENDVATGTLAIVNSTVGGSLGGDAPWAIVDGDDINMDCASGKVLHGRLAYDVDLGPSGGVTIDVKKIRVPMGKVLRVRNISYYSNTPNIGVRVNGYFSGPAASADRHVKTSESGSMIYNNISGTGPVSIEVFLMLHNYAGGVTKVFKNNAFSGAVYLADA